MLGGPLAGIHLMVKNYYVFDMPMQMKSMRLYGYSITALVIFGSIYLPENTPGIGFAAIIAGIIRMIAKEKQGELIDVFFEKGFAKESNWKCFGIGLIFMLATFFALFLVIFMMSIYTPMLLPEWLLEDV